MSSRHFTRQTPHGVYATLALRPDLDFSSISRYELAWEVEINAHSLQELVGKFARSVEYNATIRGLVPDHFDGAIRVLHPPYVPSKSRAVTWSEVAEYFGATTHAGMHWAGISGQVDTQITLSDGLVIQDPEQGRLDAHTWATLSSLLVAHTPDSPLVIGVWTGWEQLERPGSDRGKQTTWSKLTFQGEDYLFATVGHEDFADIHHREDLGWVGSAVGLTPNVAMPTNNSWALRTSIDLNSTIVAGHQSLLDDLMASPLETYQIDWDADLSDLGDRIDSPGAS